LVANNANGKNRHVKIEKSKIDFATFLKIVNRPDGFKAAGTVEDFIHGLQVFDKDNTGFISAGELRYGKSVIDKSFNARWGKIIRFRSGYFV
jgi:Ca2+-binding EF-hand superfamily protein